MSNHDKVTVVDASVSGDSGLVDKLQAIITISLQYCQLLIVIAPDYNELLVQLDITHALKIQIAEIKPAFRSLLLQINVQNMDEKAIRLRSPDQTNAINRLATLHIIHNQAAIKVAISDDTL